MKRRYWRAIGGKRSLSNGVMAGRRRNMDGLQPQECVCLSHRYWGRARFVRSRLLAVNAKAQARNHRESYFLAVSI
jgi:hypothetical protein